MSRHDFFLIGCTSLVFGIFIRSFISIPSAISGFFLAGAVCCAAYGLARSHAKALLVACSIFFVVLGIARFDQKESGIPKILPELYDTNISAQGFVWDEPTHSSAGNQQIRVKVITFPEEFFVMATVRPYPEWHVGDAIAISGKITEPISEGDFDYRAYLAKDNIYATMIYPRMAAVHDLPVPKILKGKMFLASIKRSFLERIESILPEPQAGFLAGLLLGEKSAMPKELLEEFRVTGTTHIVALSGFNISIIGDTLLKTLQFLLIPFSISFWISVAFIILFTIMVGAEASIVRAAIMGILVLAARKGSRMYDARRALLGAAAAMLFINPSLLRFDVGFQLSFFATAGILLFTPVVEEKLQWISLEPLREILVTTLSAQIMVLPILVWNFGGVSLISPIANIFILPLIPLAMLFGFIASLAGFLWSGFGMLLGLLAWVFLSYELLAVSFFSQIPLAYLEFAGWGIVAFLLLYAFSLGIFLNSNVKRVLHG